MAKELEGTIEELKKILHGEESWKTEYYKNLYNKEINGIQVYEVKPWEVMVGDVLKLRDKEVLQKLEEEQAIPAHWFEELHTYFEEEVHTITITEEIYNEILYNRGVIYSHLFDVEADMYWHFSLPMLTFVTPKEVEVVEEEEKVEPPIYSIEVEEKDPRIIEEMIKKVDKRRLKNLLNISASLGESMRCIVSNEMVDKYLNLWANAKYEFYLLFNRELTMTKEIDLEITKEEMRILKKDLCRAFPRYALYVDNTPTEYFISNEISSTYLPSEYSTYANTFFSGKGMKLSKFFSQFLQDNSFDIELSKVMQNKQVKGSIFLSIDPYDYLTSSINQHDWKSCHRITDGEWGTGSVSYLLDKTTIVSYRAKAEDEFEYNFWGFKFKGNSKLYRQLIYFDKSSCSIIFGRRYPNKNEQLSKEIRYLLEDRVAEYLGVDSSWKVYNNRYDGEFTDVCDLHYSDVKNDFEFKFARLSDSRAEVANWEVGSLVPCLCGCGEYVEERGERALCFSCQEQYGDADDYEGEDD